MKPALWHMFISFEMITYHCSVFKDLRRVFSSVLSTGDLIILSSLIHFVKHFFQNIFEEVFNFESLPLCPSDFYYYRLFHLPRQPLNYINFTLSIYSTFTKHLILYLYIMNTQYRHILFSEVYYYIVIYFNISQSY